MDSQCNSADNGSRGFSTTETEKGRVVSVTSFFDIKKGCKWPGKPEQIPGNTATFDGRKS